MVYSKNPFPKNNFFKYVISIVIIFIFSSSCKKEEDKVLENYMSFSGSQKIGNKNYISPTFDLGSPTQNIGYIYTTDVYTSTNIQIIRIASIDSINVDNNIYIKYYFDINTTIAGSNDVEVFSYLLYYCPYQDSKTAFYYHNSNKDKFDLLNKSGIKNDSDKTGMYAKVTKVGAIGEYIEGTYKLYNYNPPVLHITHGRFKVLRISPPVE